jgi:hypothetical protein
MRGCDEPERQCQGQWRVSAPVRYNATGQRECHRWSNGDFLRSGDGRGPAQLPMAEERNGYQWRDFFDLYDPTDDGR